MVSMKDALVLYDGWCERQVRRSMTWLEEWLSLSQLQTERGLIGIYLLGQIVGPLPHDWLSGVFIGCKTVAALTTSYLMFMLCSRTPEQRRRAEAFEKEDSYRFVRVACQASYLVIVVYRAMVIKHDWSNPTYTASLLTFVLVLYSSWVYPGGTPGRRRKLALSKLKELLGGWLPKPVPELPEMG